MKIALASSDGVSVNKHFGSTPFFTIAEVDANGFNIIERRENEFVFDQPEKEHNKTKFEDTVKLISDCNSVIAAKIGRAAVSELQIKNIQALEQVGSIDELLSRYVKYLGNGDFKAGTSAESKLPGIKEPKSNAPRVKILEIEHPCFASGKPNNKGRIHLPVSPGCNITCAFCSRAVNSDRTVQRPGVTGEVLTPQEALEVVRNSVAIAPEITVVGIAGPGDTLLTPYALETFRLVKAEFPDLLRCMSTNGLLLPKKADEIIEIGIDTLTVTVNAVAPEILRQIIFDVNPDKLIANQLEGIKILSAAGVTIKVNTVLVPGINDAHIEDIAKTVSEAGAKVYNIIPLIPQNMLSHISAPKCEEIDSARVQAEQYLRVFRHCQHCRADAIGVPGGKDYGEQIYANRLKQENTFSHG
ncbi:hypothetical protein FACS1894219_06380 [Clostridia bacterium]|nr:hypothetical protein FACS1894219_06380 [Clostridia bacterium]